MNWKVPLFKIYWEEDDVESIAGVIRSGMNWATGPKVEEFEQKVVDFTGVEHAVTFNSGTSALHAAMIAYGIGPGDEVIVPSFTFIATANAPLFVGGKPVFADVEEETYGLDPSDVAEKITRKTKAIMPIHVGGCPCHIRELAEIAEDRHIPLIEDAAESLGSRIGGRKVGTFGDSAMFSFCGPKVITTGEGGVIVTGRKDLAEKLKLIRSHGRAETKDYFSTNEYLDYVTLGYNWRFSNILAALGITQLAKIDRIVGMRRRNAAYMTKRLNREAPGVKTPSPPDGYYHLFQMYTIRTQGRDALMDHLGKKGIMAKVYFPPVHRTHFYRNVLHDRSLLPVTEKLAGDSLTLPMYPNLTTEDMDLMISEIGAFCGGAPA
ncbi:MAG TPA: DegT/DnrJ/EryC1/StrS family aminotransferase [Methanomicrobiales archaeon]|nr:DegT/DnrJ/EryC1/StrS family aminotransferase [Methanomicrobiales archaeon]